MTTAKTEPMHRVDVRHERAGADPSDGPAAVDLFLRDDSGLVEDRLPERSSVKVTGGLGLFDSCRGDEIVAHPRLKGVRSEQSCDPVEGVATRRRPA